MSTHLKSLLLVMLSTLAATAVMAFSAGDDEAAKKAAASPKKNLAGSSIDGISKKATSVSQVLLSRAVQKDIELTDKQFAAIDKLYRQQSSQTGPISIELRSSRDPEERARLESELSESHKLFEHNISVLLTKRQNERILQIYCRTIGANALLDPVIQDNLNVSPDQAWAIKDILESLKVEEASLLAEMRKQILSRENRISPDDYDKLAALYNSKPHKAVINSYKQTQTALHASANRQLWRLLTKRQKAKFEKMLGRPVVESSLDSADTKTQQSKDAKPDEGKQSQ